MKFIVIILALAVYGAYSLVGGLGSTTPEKTEATAKKPAPTAAPSTLQKFGLSSAADLAASAAAKVTGFDLQPIPETGCSESVLSPVQIMDLVDRLPEGQRAALAKALDATSTVWTAQLYRGETGVGLCLPKQSKLLKLPGIVSLPDWAGTDDVAGAVTSAVDNLSTQ